VFKSFLILSVATIAVVFAGTAQAQQPPKSLVFQEAGSGISFRFTPDWHLETPQRKTTVALLYADDGSGATCNINANARPELAGLNIDQTNRANAANHTQQYMLANQQRVLKDVVDHGYRRQRFGIFYDGATLEYSGLLEYGGQSQLAKGLLGSFFAEGRWMTLVCHQPVAARYITPVSASRMFNLIAATVAFGGS